MISFFPFITFGITVIIMITNANTAELIAMYTSLLNTLSKIDAV